MCREQVRDYPRILTSHPPEGARTHVPAPLAVWGLAVVRGRSMQPTLYDGDRLLLRHGATPRAGQLVVVRLPDGVVAVKRATSHDADGWWVERDNPREGVDSWSVGAIPDADVIGVVRARLWPLRRPRRDRRPWR
jgi:hypothetical protein